MALVRHAECETGPMSLMVAAFVVLEKALGEFAWLPAKAERFLVPKTYVRVQAGHEDCEDFEVNLPDSLQASLGREALSCTRVGGYRILCFTPTP